MGMPLWETVVVVVGGADKEPFAVPEHIVVILGRIGK
jgi:hypothetical protein